MSLISILPCYRLESMFELDFHVSYKLIVHFVFDMNLRSVLVDDNMSIENTQNETEIRYVENIFNR